VSVPDLLRAEAARIASTPSITTWLASTRRRSTDIGTGAVIGALDELRDAGS